MSDPMERLTAVVSEMSDRIWASDASPVDKAWLANAVPTLVMAVMAAVDGMASVSDE